MKNLNRNQSIAVVLALVLIGYLLFGNSLLSFFSPAPSNENLENTQMSQGVTIQEVSVGTGEVAEAGDVLTVHYVGTLPDGRVFDSSKDANTPINFTLGVGQVIRGWDEGVAGMRVGGKRILTISPEYAYGDQGVGSIPPNSTLIFEVELLDVMKGTSAGE